MQMIIGIWRKIQKTIKGKRTIIRYDKSCLEDLYKEGSTMLRVVYLCDDKNCKYPNRVYSIERHHLNKDRSSKLYEDLQICVFCQRSGENNPRYGDHRNFDEIHGIEKSNILKDNMKKRFEGDLNPSKLDSVKLKKGQLIINFDNVYQKSKNMGYILIDIKGDNKFARLELKCNIGHIFKVTYSNFRKNHNCKYCHYESTKLNLTDIEIQKYDNYKKAVRYSTAINYRKYKNDIDQLNLKLNSKEYHIDHIFSLSEGFLNDIDPKIISSPINLRVIKSEENLKKGSRSDMTINRLFEMYSEFILFSK